jgi:phosphoenolpyruvate-protein phosphotransferase (PTS system enzyme I)
MAASRLQGIAASPGWAIASAHVLTEHALTVAHHHIAGVEVAHEQTVLKNAFEAVHAELDVLSSDTRHKELHALIEVHRQMLTDPVLYDASLAYIADQLVNAAWALSEQVQQLADVFEAMDDAYIAERALDVRQVGQRVLRQLAGAEPRKAAVVASDKPIVLVAQDLAPADFVQWQHVALAGLITELGGQSSHTAIMARAHGIPAVLGIAQAADRIKDGDLIALNGSTGELWVNPSAEQLGLLMSEQAAWNAQQALATAQVQQPAITACGQTVLVLGNIEHPEDMPHVLGAGLDGVGLFRSEFLFMGRDALPSEDKQTAAYTAVVQALNGKPATIRTLDVGADKILNAAHAHDSATSPNPALGLRAVRYCLAHPDLFLTQLRAILRAAAHGPVNLLIPMIASASEVQACQRLLSQAHLSLQADGIAHGAVKLGVMVEIPAAAIAIHTLVPLIDFCSIGTNDLIQYTLAIDRTDAAVAALYDPVHPAVTALLSQVFAACAAAGKPVSVCGEMAGDARYTHHLLNLGLRQFSLNPSQAPAVKAAVRTWAS